MNQYRDLMDDLETQVEQTEEEFDSFKGDIEPDKREKAEDLINEIESQIEFLEEQMEKMD